MPKDYIKIRFDLSGNKFNTINNIFKFLLILITFSSCSNGPSNKKTINKSEITDKDKKSINFLDKKYFNGYMMSFGDSDISEHPYRYYYNYKNEEVQWFAISYVPKDISLHNYWLNYLEDSNADENTQSSIIEKIVNKDLSSYNVFAAYIPKKYLDISNGESEEAMFFKNNTEVYLYLYNLSEKKWKLLKKVKTNSPLIGKRDFFYKLFPELFSPDKVSKLSDNKNCVTSIIEMGIIEECILVNTSIEKVYKDIFKNAQIEESEYLLKSIPERNQIMKVDKNGLINIEYKINSNKLEIEFNYEGGINSIKIEQIKENVKRTIIHSAD